MSEPENSKPFDARDLESEVPPGQTEPGEKLPEREGDIDNIPLIWPDSAVQGETKVRLWCESGRRPTAVRNGPC